MSFVVPAVLPTSREDLEQKLALLAPTLVDRIQIDVVDGRFAAPASWPYNAAPSSEEADIHGKMLPELHHIEYEIDLMCLDAYQAASFWLARGASRLTFHAESVINLSRLIASAHKNYGCGPASCGVISIGLALNIESSLSLIEPYLKQIDYVQFMGIARIGRQGQPFDRRVCTAIRNFRLRYPHIPVQVDGGVSRDTVRDLVSLGVSNIVVGSSILRAADPSAAIAELEAFQSPYGV